MTNTLEPGHTYDNVFILFVDAAGHSNVVARNPADLAGEFYNILEKKILDRFETCGSKNRCNYYDRWGWQGDGGMFIVHDSRESIALNTVITFAKHLLELDLPALKEEFSTIDISGSFHIRISLHKGHIKYISDERRGSIHSVSINQAAHLEKITPKDCLSITGSVFEILGSQQTEFYLVGEFEGNNIALFSPGLTDHQLQRKWYSGSGIGGENIRTLIQRPSESQKANVLGTADEAVVDVGTALRTCVRYLNSTQRPAIFRDSVLELLRAGIKYKCFLLDPNGESVISLSKKNNENLNQKINSSLKGFRDFKEKYPEVANNLEIYTYDLESGIAAIGIDINSSDGMMLFSPMMTPLSDSEIERADLPHFVIDNSLSTYRYYLDYINLIIGSSTLIDVSEFDFES